MDPSLSKSVRVRLPRATEAPPTQGQHTEWVGLTSAQGEPPISGTQVPSVFYFWAATPPCRSWEARDLGKEEATPNCPQKAPIILWIPPGLILRGGSCFSPLLGSQHQHPSLLLPDPGKPSVGKLPSAPVPEFGESLFPPANLGQGRAEHLWVFHLVSSD